MNAVKILLIISFGVMSFCLGWLFDAYIMSERLPLGSASDYRKIAVRCLAAFDERSGNIDKFLSAATRVAAEPEKKE